MHNFLDMLMVLFVERTNILQASLYGEEIWQSCTSKCEVCYA